MFENANPVGLNTPVRATLVAPSEKIGLRFEQEAWIGGKLDHPGLVKVYERGQYGQQLFVAMEWIEGPSLADVVARGDRLPLEDCLDIMRQLTEGVTQVHGAGIVHRDLKPANVMLLPLEERGRLVKLLDFDIARTSSLTRLTETGVIVGTVGYLAPEQIQGGEVDRRTDVWSLGVVLYELLAGALPLDAETLQRMNLSQRLRHSTDTDFPRPSERLKTTGDSVALASARRATPDSLRRTLRFAGVSDAELIGARIELTADGRRQVRWIHSNHTYKSGGALDAHFGLGRAEIADVTVTLLTGTTRMFAGLSVDQSHNLKLGDLVHKAGGRGSE